MSLKRPNQFLLQLEMLQKRLREKKRARKTTIIMKVNSRNQNRLARLLSTPIWRKKLPRKKKVKKIISILMSLKRPNQFLLRLEMLQKRLREKKRARKTIIIMKVILIRSLEPQPLFNHCEMLTQKHQKILQHFLIHQLGHCMFQRIWKSRKLFKIMNWQQKMPE